MKSIYLFLFMAVANLTAWSQATGTIRGIVKTSNDNPAEFVNVSLEGTSKGAIAGVTGTYEINKVQPGNYVLVASFVGLQSQKTASRSKGRRGYHHKLCVDGKCDPAGRSNYLRACRIE